MRKRNTVRFLSRFSEALPDTFRLPAATVPIAQLFPLVASRTVSGEAFQILGRLSLFPLFCRNHAQNQYSIAIIPAKICFGKLIQRVQLMKDCR
jgi:hypothetical protein